MKKKVMDIMHIGSENAVIGKESCFRDVLEEMDSKKMGSVCIVDSQNKLIGIITDGDIRRLLLKTQDTLPELFMKNVKSIMIPDPKTISPDINLNDCLQVLKQYRFWVLPVVDEKQTFVGMVHMHTLLRAMEL